MKRLTIALLILGMSFGSMAQEKETQRENRKAQKIAFISMKLELSNNI